MPRMKKPAAPAPEVAPVAPAPADEPLPGSAAPPPHPLMVAPEGSLCARCQHFDRIASLTRGYYSCLSFPRIPPWSLDGTQCEVGPVGGIPLGRRRVE